MKNTKLELNCAVDKFDKVVFVLHSQSTHITINHANGRGLGVVLDAESLEQLRNFLSIGVDV